MSWSGVAWFLLGLGAGVLVREVIFQVERRTAMRRRLQAPPFTTEQGSNSSP